MKKHIHVYYILFLVYLLVFAAILFAGGCKTTERGAVRKVSKVHHDQRKILANYCSIYYDPVVLEYLDTVYKEGEVIIDTVTVDCDSVMEIPIITKIVKVPCPPKKTDTILITKTITTVDKARIEALSIERDKAILSGEKQRQGRKIWMWIAISLMAYTVLRWVLKAWIKITLP